MGIEGRSREECFERFRTHIAKLAKDIIPAKYPVRYAGDTERRILAFANDQHAGAIPIQTTACGTVYLYVAQELTTVQKASRLFRLRTSKYWYNLYSSPPDEKSDAAIRWEYAREEQPRVGWCLNHVQFAAQNGPAPSLTMGNGRLDLNRAHLPTGWVLIEHVFRFLIHDLGMQAACGNQWPDVLHKSEEAFFNDFTT